MSGVSSLICHPSACATPSSSSDTPVILCMPAYSNWVWPVEYRDITVGPAYVPPPSEVLRMSSRPSNGAGDSDDDARRLPWAGSGDDDADGNPLPPLDDNGLPGCG